MKLFSQTVDILEFINEETGEHAISLDNGDSWYTLTPLSVKGKKDEDKRKPPVEEKVHKSTKKKDRDFKRKR